jgi:hypothetical protein
MNYLRGFVPWIAFAVLSGAGWQWGALAGLVLAVALFADGRRKGTPLDSQVLEISTIVYFAVLTAFSFLVPAWPSGARSRWASPSSRRRRSSGTTRSSGASTWC